jgi:nucleoside 2-deoxyribosyltransferase
MFITTRRFASALLLKIRRSRFVVADVTNQKEGMYFEAGFAMALGLPVIWCCRKDDLDKLHFDTRQYNHIVWDQPSDLRDQLSDTYERPFGWDGELGMQVAELDVPIVVVSRQ